MQAQITITKQIGRYTLPITAIFAVEQRSGFVASLVSLRLFLWSAIKSAARLKLFRESLPWPSAGYTVTLSTGARYHFTAEEKEIYERELQFHNQVMQVMGLCKALGHPGMR